MISSWGAGLVLVTCVSSCCLAADHSALDLVLRACVVDERVDYEKIKASYLPDLDRYLAVAAEADPASMDRDAQLAFYINVYNATMIRAVIDRGGGKFKPSDDDFAVFRQKLVRLREGSFSLNELENEIIRKRFGDPRIHAALVCAAVSCPPIIPRAYSAAGLNEVLDENMRRWLNDPKRNQIDRVARKLKLSKIFDWYAADFGGQEKLPEYVAGVLGEDVRGYTVEFLEYDWTLNGR